MTMDAPGASPRASSLPSRMAAIAAGELVNKTSVMLAFMYLARTLDPATYGDVEWALSATMVFALASDAGLSTWASAHVSTRPAESVVVVRRVAWLRAALAVPSYAVLVLLAAVRGGQAGAALCVYGLVLFLTPFFLQYLFNGLQSRWAAAGNAARGATFALAVIWLVSPGSPPIAVALAEVLAAGALAVCNVVILRAVFQAVRTSRPDQSHAVVPRTTSRDLLDLLARSWRVGASEMAWGVLWFSGLVLTGYLASSTDAAWHSSGLRLLLALHTGVWLYLYVLLPNLTQLLARDPAGWRLFTERSLRLASWTGVGVALAVALAASPILVAVYGEPFAAAVPVLQALVWVVPIAWISGHVRYSFIAAGRPEKDYHAALAGAAAAVVLTLVLLPRWGSAGAAWALLSGIIVNAIAAFALARTVLPPLSLARNAAPALLAGMTGLLLGRAVAPRAGAAAAALAAAVLVATTALVVERHQIRALLEWRRDSAQPGLRPGGPLR